MNHLLEVWQNFILSLLRGGLRAKKLDAPQVSSHCSATCILMNQCIQLIY
uniref:Uncharacterized protein n=1 Tax=Arundo donax TaxID=35708 RepID=A0A0A8ZJD4_ARUDO